MDQSLRCIDTVKRFVGQAVQVVMIHQTDSDSLLESMCLDLSPCPLDMVSVLSTSVVSGYSRIYGHCYMLLDSNIARRNQQEQSFQYRSFGTQLMLLGIISLLSLG